MGGKTLDQFKSRQQARKLKEHLSSEKPESKYEKDKK